jgi:aspartyl/glutamyl-tRNA(Asn/Gln) amidotransferase B subunit
MSYEPVIGLEVHVQLKTKSKMFCACSTEFGVEGNKNTCPVCLGWPGSLPVVNEQALKLAIKAGLALNCKVAERLKFDRKNYFYPDLPKAYQISQFDMPVNGKGELLIETKTADGKMAERTIGITRAHLEEDAGKLLHEGIADGSLVDYNRGGVPLLEIVSEPDLRSPQEAYDYLTALKAILQYVEVSDCDMEKGSLRCDANVSVRPVGQEKFGTKVEIKNLNSFKMVQKAIQYEIERQTGMLEDKETIVQETRLWDDKKARRFPCVPKKKRMITAISRTRTLWRSRFPVTWWMKLKLRYRNCRLSARSASSKSSAFPITMLSCWCRKKRSQIILKRASRKALRQNPRATGSDVLLALLMTKNSRISACSVKRSKSSRAF